MSVTVLLSATGAPGVTTTALALGETWTRQALLLEADMKCGSDILAGYYGGRLPHERGLITLAIAHRSNALDTTVLMDTAWRLHPTSPLLIIPGLASTHQRTAMPALWQALPRVLAPLEQSGVDVLVDAGRVSAVSLPVPLLTTADAIVLVTRTDLKSLVTARASLEQLRQQLEGLAWQRFSLLLVGEGHPYHRNEIAKALDGVPTSAAMPLDAKAAAALNRGAVTDRAWRKSKLKAAAAAAGAALVHQADERRLELAAQETLPADPDAVGVVAAPANSVAGPSVSWATNA